MIGNIPNPIDSLRKVQSASIGNAEKDRPLWQCFQHANSSVNCRFVDGAPASATDEAYAHPRDR